MSDTPLRSAYVDVGASVTRLRGSEAWVEAGVHPWRNVALYGRGYVVRGDYGAMVGLRGEWRW